MSKARTLIIATGISAIGVLVPIATASAASFTAEKYPALISGSSTRDVFDTFGAQFSCIENTFTSSLAATSEELVITPSFNKCTAFGGAMPVTAPSGAFTLTPDGTLHLTKEIQLHFWMSGGKPVCTFNVTPGTSKISVTNLFPNIVLSGSAQFPATQTRLSPICPTGTKGTFAWTIQAGGIQLQGQTLEGGPNAIHLK